MLQGLGPAVFLSSGMLHPGASLELQHVARGLELDFLVKDPTHPVSAQNWAGPVCAHDHPKGATLRPSAGDSNTRDLSK